MGQVYSSSKIVFNKSIGGDVNMRVFEALAAGALLITDRIGNGLDHLLTEGVHYVGYDTVEEAVEQIDRYLADEPARARIADAGQALLQTRHTYDVRLERILQTVQVAGADRPAPARHVDMRQRRVWLARWARLHGTGIGAAAGLLLQGLPPRAMVDLAVGIARQMKHRWAAGPFFSRARR
jgi:hypothetical protein